MCFDLILIWCDIPRSPFLIGGCKCLSLCQVPTGIIIFQDEIRFDEFNNQYLVHLVSLI
jgi:hypothetical protein